MNWKYMLKNKIITWLANKILNNNTISGNVRIGVNTKIIGSELGGEITIGDHCKIRFCKIRGNVTIGRYTSLAGKNIDIVSQVNTVTIGSFCSIASNVTVQEFNHPISKLSTYYIQKHILGNSVSNDRSSKGEVTIGNDVWIGTNAVILSGVQIGNGVIIASNAVVTHNVPSYAIVAGIPAKVIKYRFSEDVIQVLEKIKWWNWSIEKIKENRVLFESDTIQLDDLKKVVE